MKNVTYWAVVSAMLGLLAVGCNHASSTVKNPENNEQMTLTVPGEVKVKQGDVAKFEISIKRKDFNGPVFLSFKDLPTGVTIKESERKILSGEDKSQFTLVAAKDAKVVSNQDTKVTAASEDGKLKAEKIMKVTVQEKK